MTNKKRRQLEEEERRRAEAAERQAADARQGSVPTYYGAVNFGEVNGYALPVTKGQVQGIQLPPIIQPISLTLRHSCRPGSRT